MTHWFIVVTKPFLGEPIDVEVFEVEGSMPTEFNTAWAGSCYRWKSCPKVEGMLERVLAGEDLGKDPECEDVLWVQAQEDYLRTVYP